MMISLMIMTNWSYSLKWLWLWCIWYLVVQWWWWWWLKTLSNSFSIFFTMSCVRFILMIPCMMTKCMMIIMLATLISTFNGSGFLVVWLCEVKGPGLLVEVTRPVPPPPQNNICDHQQILLSLYHYRRPEFPTRWLSHLGEPFQPIWTAGKKNHTFSFKANFRI